MMNEGIVLVDADDASITVAWPTIGKPSSSNPTKYSLQYRPSTSSTDNGIDSGGSLLYNSLATDLAGTTARKRNLTGAGHGFWFRVSAATRPKSSGSTAKRSGETLGGKGGAALDKSSMDYVGHACRRPFRVLTMLEQSRRMAAPRARVDVSAASPAPNSYVAHVSWAPYQKEQTLGYKLQMRENDGKVGWSTVAKCLSGTEVRKKNLTSKHGYMFRVRPVLEGETGGSESNLDTCVCEGGNIVPFSNASDVVGARREKSSSGNSSNSDLIRLFKNLPKNTLLAKGGMSSVPLADAFANTDLVFLYASAHWCPPCRKFTPQLIRFYNEARKFHKSNPTLGKSVEVVFVSADHDISGFKNYYATMPWLAVPFTAETRERLMSWMKVTGVPKLMCLDGRSGKILESNSVGRALDISRFSKMIK